MKVMGVILSLGYIIIYIIILHRTHTIILYTIQGEITYTPTLKDEKEYQYR